MNIVVMKRKKGCSKLVTLCHKKLTLLVVGTFVLIPAAIFHVGYSMGMAHMKANPDDMMLAMQLQKVFG